MKRNDRNYKNDMEQFSQKLYKAVNQRSKDVVVPPFDAVVDRIARVDSIESFEQFFGDSAKSSRAAKSRKSLVRIFGMAAAALAFTMCGILVASVVNSRLFDTNQQSSAYCEDSMIQEVHSMSGAAEDSYNGEDTKKSEALMEDAYIADVCSHDCAEVIISGGRKLFVPLEELEAAIDGGD